MAGGIQDDPGFLGDLGLLMPVLTPIEITTPALPAIAATPVGIVAAGAALAGWLGFHLGSVLYNAVGDLFAPTYQAETTLPFPPQNLPQPEIVYPPIEVAPPPYFEVQEPTPLTPITVTGRAGPSPYVLPPMPEFFPGEPGTMASPGGNVPQPDYIPQLPPAVGFPMPAVPTAPAVPLPRRTVEPVPRTFPEPSPVPSPRPSPIPSTSPSPGPRPMVRPVIPLGRPIESPTPTRVMPDVGMPFIPLPAAKKPTPRLTTPIQTGVPSFGIEPIADAQPQTKGKKCSPSKQEDKKKHGCRQGYFRETTAGVTFITWSRRHCPSS